MPEFELASSPGLSDADARLVQAVLGDLYARTGDLSPETIVEESRDEAAPLHRFFNWDDTDAARKYRLMQARGLVKKVRVKRVGDTSSPPRTIPEYFKVIREEGKKYAHVSEVMSDADLRRGVVQKAWQMLMAWRRQYANLSELASIFDAIDQAAAQAERQAAAGGASRRRSGGGGRSQPRRRR